MLLSKQKLIAVLPSEEECSFCVQIEVKLFFCISLFPEVSLEKCRCHYQNEIQTHVLYKEQLQGTLNLLSLPRLPEQVYA